MFNVFNVLQCVDSVFVMCYRCVDMDTGLVTSW